MKRQNDNPQASKEDYERLSKMGSQVGHGFERVNPEVLKKRRILKARHPPSSSGGGGGGGGGSASKRSDAQTKSNPFASVSLVKEGGSSSSSKPTFAFGSFTSSKPATTTTSPGFSFGSKPVAASVTPSVASSDLKTKYEQRAVNMESSFRSTLDRHGTQCNWLNVFDQYMDSVVKMKFEYFTELKSNPPPTTGGLASTPATMGGAISFGGFGSGSTTRPTTSNATTTPSGTNLFGSFASSSSSTTAITNKAPSFSFGSKSATTSLAPTTFGTVDKTTTATSNDTTTTDAAPAEDQQPLDRSDVEWDDVELIENVLLYHKRNDNKPTKFASGPCRIQKKKSDPTVRRIIHRDIAGKVRFNVQIYKGMDFAGSVYKRKTGHRERVIFMGIMDKEHGREMFEIHRLQVPGSSLQEILKKAADF